jgi:hypothetical protein
MSRLRVDADQPKVRPWWQNETQLRPPVKNNQSIFGVRVVCYQKEWAIAVNGGSDVEV